MSKVKIGIIDQPIPDVVQLLRQRAANLTGNPFFPAPTPSPAQLNAMADALEAAYNAAQTARDVARTKTALQDEAGVAAVQMYNQLANMVDNQSAGNAAAIESVGFAVRAGNTPLGILPQPTAVVVQPGTAEGTVNLKWQRIHGARTYVVQKALGTVEPLNWEPGVVATKPKATVEGLTSGSKYSFRLAPVGAAGQGAWSDVVTKFAP